MAIKLCGPASVRVDEDQSGRVHGDGGIVLGEEVTRRSLQHVYALYFGVKEWHLSPDVRESAPDLVHVLSLHGHPILDKVWRVVFAYARRWQVEMTYRFAKSELAMQSPRLWRWENRLKLLLMATLVYAFLLSLLDSALEPLRTWLLRHWCHRTGKRNRDASIPLYRLRSAVSRLWLAHAPPPISWENSG